MEHILNGFLIGIGIIGGLSFGILVIPISKSKTQKAQEEFNKKLMEFWEKKDEIDRKMYSCIERVCEFYIKNKEEEGWIN